MSIRARILTLVSCFAILALVVTGLGLQTIADDNRSLHAYDHAYDNALRAERLNHIVSNVVLETRGLYVARSDEELRGFVKGLNTNLDALQLALAQWEASLTPSESDRLAAIQQDAQAFISLRRQVAEYAAAGRLEDAHTLSTNNRADRIAFQNKVDAIVLKTVSELNTAKAETETRNRDRTTVFLVACIGSILILLAAALWLVTHFVTRPLRQLAAAIVRTSKGDYAVPLPAGDGKTEIGEVWQALSVLKFHAIEAEQLRQAEHERELKLREIMLD
ncbi:HAMP domain-containing protein [Asticcacaulis solisilvae]|uniref:HAMP domain-containing protein n=1 Tax=Asticcacaulis solisilvae TaxID=1217274 RepID=UPI003FD83158